MYRVETDRVVARLGKMADAASLFSLYTGQKGESKYLARLPHQTVDQTAKFLGTWSTKDSWRKGSRVCLVVEEKESKTVIGVLVLLRIADKIEFHFGISHKYSGKGIVTELIESLICQLKDEHEVVTLSTYCDVEHVASQRVLENSGLKKGEVLRGKYQNPNMNNEHRDCYLYSLKLRQT